MTMAVLFSCLHVLTMMSNSAAPFVVIEQAISPSFLSRVAPVSFVTMGKSSKNPRKQKKKAVSIDVPSEDERPVKRPKPTGPVFSPNAMGPALALMGFLSNAAGQGFLGATNPKIKPSISNSSEEEEEDSDYVDGEESGGDEDERKPRAVNNNSRRRTNNNAPPAEPAFEPYQIECLSGRKDDAKRMEKCIRECMNVVWRAQKWAYNPATTQKLAGNLLDEVGRKYYPEELLVDPTASPEKQAWQRENRVKWLRVYTTKCLGGLNHHRSAKITPSFKMLIWEVLEGSHKYVKPDGSPWGTNLLSVEDVEKCCKREMDPNNPDEAAKFFFYCRHLLPAMVGKKILLEKMFATALISELYVPDSTPNRGGQRPLLVNPSSEGATCALYKCYSKKWVDQFDWKKQNIGATLPSKFKDPDDETNEVEAFPSLWVSNATGPREQMYGGWAIEGIQYFIQMSAANKRARGGAQSIALERDFLAKMEHFFPADAAAANEADAIQADPHDFDILDLEF